MCFFRVSCIETEIVSGNGINTEVKASKRKSSTSVDVTLTVKLEELKRLREKCNSMEETECVLNSTIEQLKHRCQDKQDEVDKLNMENQTYQRDLENYIAKTNVSFINPMKNYFVSANSLILDFNQIQSISGSQCKVTQNIISFLQN